jgi:hypothetical protein
VSTLLFPLDPSTNTVRTEGGRLGYLEKGYLREDEEEEEMEEGEGVTTSYWAALEDIYDVDWHFLSWLSRCTPTTKIMSSYGVLTLLTMVNSPASTLLLYMLDVNGSVLSLLPMIWAVEAVGIGAISRELRTPKIKERRDDERGRENTKLGKICD